MIIQNSYNNETSTLYLVPTPIGNFLDMTFRAIEVLKTVDFIFAEDTRVTKVLLSHFQITTKLKSYHIFNEDVQSQEIIELLREGNNIAIVSDAGLPGISDPGFLVAKRALENNFSVISLPGANAALTALVASGLPCERFYFYGFLKHKASQKEKELEALVNFDQTIIFYESPHRINETINILYKVLGNREAVIARELTKKYEEYIRGNLEDLCKVEHELKGEIVVLVKGADKTKESIMLLDKTIYEHYNYYLEQGLDSKDAMKQVAKERNVSKSEIYKVINKK